MKEPQNLHNKYCLGVSRFLACISNACCPSCFKNRTESVGASCSSSGERSAETELKQPCGEARQGKEEGQRDVLDKWVDVIFVDVLV